MIYDYVNGDEFVLKKRALEAAGIFAALIAAFVVINLLAGGIGDSVTEIDGEYYNVNDNDISMILMTEDGLENIGRLKRLTSLKITSYTESVIYSLSSGDPGSEDKIRRETEAEYPGCTDLADLSFLSELTKLERLDVSCCAVSDISFAASLEKLEALNIAHTNVSDLSVLADMDNISELVITDIPAEDYSPLLEMDGLLDVKMDEKDEHIVAELRKKGVKVQFPEKSVGEKAAEELAAWKSEQK